MRGKDKCQILKEIRRQIAEENDIEWVVSECSHKGECKGTCPKCESEVRKLERELSLRRRIGKSVAIAGISAACVTGLTACSLEDVADYGMQVIEGVSDLIASRSGGKIVPEQVEDLSGDVYIEDDLSGAAGYDDDIYVLDGEVAYPYEDWE